MILMSLIALPQCHLASTSDEVYFERLVAILIRVLHSSGFGNAVSTSSTLHCLGVPPAVARVYLPLS